MSKGRPTYECSNGCPALVTRRGMCAGCAAERREAAEEAARLVAGIREAHGDGLPQYVEVRAPARRDAPVPAAESIQDPPMVVQAVPRGAAAPVPLPAPLRLATVSVPPVAPACGGGRVVAHDARLASDAQRRRARVAAILVALRAGWASVELASERAGMGVARTRDALKDALDAGKVVRHVEGSGHYYALPGSVWGVATVPPLPRRIELALAGGRVLRVREIAEELGVDERAVSSAAKRVPGLQRQNGRWWIE